MNFFFRDLFSVRITHAYYGGQCEDVGFLIPAETARNIGNLRLIAKTIDGRLRVVYEADEKRVAMLRVPDQTLRIGLDLRNSSFHNITADTVDPRSTLLVFRNSGANKRELAAPVKATPVSGILNHAIKKATRPITITLTDPHSASTGIVIADATQTSVTFDLSDQLAGMYQLEERYPAGPEPVVNYYHHRELIAAAAFAIVEVTIDDSFYDNHASFEIAFPARSETLKYFVSARGFSDTNFLQLAVIDEGFVEERRDKVEFSRVEQPDVQAELLGDGDAKVVLFESVNTVTRRQRGRRKIQLKRNGEVLVEHLPQPSAAKSDANMIVFVSKT